ncbi:hypothetical protein JCM17960_29120 [Magnetospira thiophila]
MSTDTAHAVAGEEHHEHHWETSSAPLLVVAGLFFLVPMGFSAYFVYENVLLTTIYCGVGTPLLLWGIARWVAEGLVYKPLKDGLAGIALPIFIVSEVFIFLGLFAGYWSMRIPYVNWPPEGTPHIDLLLPSIMTVLLVTSSITIHIGEEKLFHHRDMDGFRKWLFITVLIGLAFLACTIYEYSHLVHLGFVPGTNAYSSAFFSITGFHASHVFVGLAAFVAVAIPAMSGRTNDTFVKCVSIYWHFVDVVWFFVVTQIYFW